MNNLNDKYSLVYNFNGNFYLFELESNGTLIYKVFDENLEMINKFTISNKEVIKFNLALDKNRIILIYLLATGEVFLRINEGMSWTEAQIGNFDTRSNKYHQLEVLYLNNKIHLIYSFSNYINSEIVSIQHLVLDKRVEEQNSVIKYVLRKNYNEFTLDFDEMGTIHLIYNTTTSFESYIYHSFYSPYRGAWSNNPKELSTRGKENSNPYIFIDSKSNVHTSWLELDNNRYKLKYAMMPINGKDKYIWKNINIPIHFNSSFTPLIYEENSSLNLLSYDSNSIRKISSSDYGKTWTDRGDSQVINIGQYIRYAISKEIHPQGIIKDVLVKNLRINNLTGLYLALEKDRLVSDDNIVKGQKSPQTITEIKVEEETTSNQLNEDDLRQLIIKILNEEKESLLREVLDNDKAIFEDLSQVKKLLADEIEDLKNTISEIRPSLFNKLFR